MRIGWQVACSWQLLHSLPLPELGAGLELGVGTEVGVGAVVGTVVGAVVGAGVGADEELTSDDEFGLAD